MNIEKLPAHAFLNNEKKITSDLEFKQALELIPYTEPQWKKLFIKPPNIKNFSKLQMTKVGLYSIAQPDMSAALIRFIKNQINWYNDNAPAHKKIQNPTITETNGGLGGFTLSLLQNFKKINVVEINPTHASIIKNNMKIYGHTVKVINDNYLNVLNKLNQDIIISDPPWGGKEFIHKKKLRLGFSNIDIVFVINYLIAADKFKMFIFLAPVNYDFEYFFKYINCKSAHVQKIRHHNYICISNI